MCSSFRFVDTYLDLHSKKVVPPEEIFQKTVDLLKAEGVQLQTIQEKEAIDLVSPAYMSVKNIM